jgi:hypothetical protein
MATTVNMSRQGEQEEVPDITDEQLEAKYVKKFRPCWPSLQVQYHWLRYDENKQNILQCD